MANHQALEFEPTHDHNTRHIYRRFLAFLHNLTSRILLMTGSAVADGQ
jgi:hypothetical protein